MPSESVPLSDRQEVLSLALKAFVSSSNPMPLGVRLLRFGTAVVPSLLEVWSNPPTAEHRLLTALMLLNKGNLTGVPLLLHEVEQWGEWGVTAALALANAGVADHAPAIIDKIRQYSLTSAGEFPGTEEDVILTLLGVLKQLGVAIPEDVKNKFSSPSAPTYFQQAIAKYESIA